MRTRRTNVIRECLRSRSPIVDTSLTDDNDSDIDEDEEDQEDDYEEDDDEEDKEDKCYQRVSPIPMRRRMTSSTTRRNVSPIPITGCCRPTITTHLFNGQ